MRPRERRAASRKPSKSFSARNALDFVQKQGEFGKAARQAEVLCTRHKRHFNPQVFRYLAPFLFLQVRVVVRMVDEKVFCVPADFLPAERLVESLPFGSGKLGGGNLVAELAQFQRKPGVERFVRRAAGAVHQKSVFHFKSRKWARGESNAGFSPCEGDVLLRAFLSLVEFSFFRKRKKSHSTTGPQ